MLLQALYFALPIYLANITPVFSKKLNLFNIPINKKLFGSHKTYQGFIFGILMAILVTFIQYRLNLQISLLDYSNFLLIGFLFGFGALFGDLIKSYFKRKLKIKPGNPWTPFDQLDFLIGSLVFISLVYIPSLKIILILLIITPIGHIVVNYISYYFGQIKRIK